MIKDEVQEIIIGLTGIHFNFDNVDEGSVVHKESFNGYYVEVTAHYERFTTHVKEATWLEPAEFGCYYEINEFEDLAVYYNGECLELDEEQIDLIMLSLQTEYIGERLNIG